MNRVNHKIILSSKFRNNLFRLLFFLTLTAPLKANQVFQLSGHATVSLLTCGPGNRLFEAFGHSAVRVRDPLNHIDFVYNYGTFNFNQPNFYINFAKGYLEYYLSKTTFDHFARVYRYHNRSISEQVLNLSYPQKQEIFFFLEQNALPENRYYFYDYLYDNCSTRIRDAFEEVLGKTLEFDPDYVKPQPQQRPLSFRELIDVYAAETQPWGDFGIDLCLGAEIDQVATPYQCMFLPDYLEAGFDGAVISSAGSMPLVGKKQVVFEALPTPGNVPFFTPSLVFWLLFILVVLLTFWEIKNNRNLMGWDILLFSTYGLLGVILLMLWIATDHKSAQNYNLLWAFPLHFPVAILMLLGSARKWVRYYLFFTLLLTLCLFAGWYIFPQKLHPAIAPLALTLGFRAFYRYVPDVFRSKLSKLAA